MRDKATRSWRDRLEIQYTSRPLSGWGGLISVFRFFETLHLRDWLRTALPDSRTSNNLVPSDDLVLQLMTSVLIGGTRFEHISRVKADPVIPRMLGAKRLGAPDALTRYLRDFQPSQIQHMTSVFGRLIFQLLEQQKEDVLDLDSTVLLRHGEQEGSSYGYNPKKRRQPSHHPILAMLAKSKVIVHCWLRPGSASTFNNTPNFLRELLDLVPESFRITAVRADSGFYSKEFLELLEEQGLDYTVAVRKNQFFDRWFSTRSNWTKVTPQIELAEGEYKGKGWAKSRRMIVIRKRIEYREEGLLFPRTRDEYHAIITSLTAPAEQVWRFYNGRGDCENRIKELKQDYGITGHCMQSFYGTETALRLICLTYNLISFFKADILSDTAVTLGTLRSHLFVMGASAGSSGRRQVLRLGLRGRWAQEFGKLLERLNRRASSIAAQLAQALITCDFPAPSAWRRRPPPGLRFFAY